VLGDGWIGQVALWGSTEASESKSEEGRRVPVAMPRVRRVPDDSPSPLPRVRSSRGQRTKGADPLPVVRKDAVRRLQDDIQPLTVVLEAGTLTIRSDGFPARVKPRPRTTQTGHVYMPADYMTWKRQIAGRVALALNGCPVWRQDRLSLELWFWTGKGDIDNLAGGVMDALNGIAWFDDEQVIDLVARKRPRAKNSPKWIAIVRVSPDA
jgi:Holliday junction resolvase RusA-like endonuclease